MRIKNVPFLDLSRQHRPIEKKLIRAFEKITQQNGYILGSDVDKFETEFSTSTGATYTIGTANGTDALLLALKAFNISHGDEVITVSHSFISTALAITYAGATPVFVDIEPKTYTINPHLIEQSITSKTKAILPVCLYGLPVDFNELKKLCKKHNLKLIVDACQAHGATYNNQPMGSFADAVCYSFYPGKNLGALGDAGAVTTNNKKIAAIIKTMRNIGRTGWYEHPILGYNSRLDTIQAAFLRLKLQHLNTWNKQRQLLAKRYSDKLRNLPFSLPLIPANMSHVFHLYCIRSAKRNQLKVYLERKGIAAHIHYPIPIHKQKAYRSYNKQHLPVTEKVAEEILSLPLFPGMTKKEQDKVVAEIHLFFTR